MQTNQLPASRQRRLHPGMLPFAAGVVTAISVTMIGLTSFTSFNPPGWLRIVTMAPLPFALILAVAWGLTGVRRSAGRGWAIAGLALAALALVAFIAMIIVGG